MLRLFLALWLATAPTLAWAGSMSLLGAGKPPVGGGGGGYTGPGDVVGSASTWYGLRAYTATYATSLGNIADIVDTATGGFSCTIKANSSGNADLTSLSCTGGTLSVTTFCTVTHAAGCSVSKLYDQTAGGNCGGTCDVSQAVLSKMPTLILSCLGSMPCLNFASAASQTLVSAANLATGAQPSTHSLVANETSAHSGLIFSVNGIQYIYFLASTKLEMYGPPSTIDVAITLNAWQAMQAIFNGASSISYINGSSNSGNAGTTTGSGKVTFGDDGGGNLLQGEVMEAGFWASGFNGTQQSNMNSNQRSYWGF